MSTTTDLSTLKINYLTQAQYDAAVSGGTINENELYLTPAEEMPDLQVRSVTWTYSVAADAGVNTNLKTLIDADLPSGDRCLGVVGFTTNDNYVVVNACYYGNSNYSIQLKNTWSDVRSNRNMVVYYLCVKD